MSGGDPELLALGSGPTSKSCAACGESFSCGAPAAVVGARKCRSALKFWLSCERFMRIVCAGHVSRLRPYLRRRQLSGHRVRIQRLPGLTSCRNTSYESESEKRAAALPLGAEAVDGGIPRQGVGQAGARRPFAFRVSDSRRRAGGIELGDRFSTSARITGGRLTGSMRRRLRRLPSAKCVRCWRMRGSCATG